KYNFGIVLAAPLAICAVHGLRAPLPPESGSGGRHGRRWTPCALGGARWLVLLGPLLIGLGALVGFAVGMPEAIWSFSDVRDGMIRQAELGARRWPGQAPDPALLLYGTTLVQAFAPPALLSAALGL